MNRPYHIAFYNKELNKYMFLGPGEERNLWVTDFQSAQHFSMPESKRELPQVKRICKDKKLEILKIPVMVVK